MAGGPTLRALEHVSFTLTGEADSRPHAPPESPLTPAALLEGRPVPPVQGRQKATRTHTEARDPFSGRNAGSSASPMLQSRLAEMLLS